MIIDVHAHYTQSPPQLEALRGWQVSQQNKPGRRDLEINADMIRQSLQAHLRQMRERGIDRCMFSSRAAGMGHGQVQRVAEPDGSSKNLPRKRATALSAGEALTGAEAFWHLSDGQAQPAGGPA